MVFKLISSSGHRQGTLLVTEVSLFYSEFFRHVHRPTGERHQLLDASVEMAAVKSL